MIQLILLLISFIAVLCIVSSPRNFRYFKTMRFRKSSFLLLFVLATVGAKASAYKVSKVTVATQTGSLVYGTAGSVTYTITLTETGSTAATTQLSLNWTAPNGVTATFSSGTSFNLTGDGQIVTLTMSSSNATPAGDSTFTVTSTSGARTSAVVNFIVGAKSLTITAPTIASKIYDGTDTASAVTVGTLSGFVGSETVTATAKAANYSSANVGSYAGNVITYTLANGTNGGVASNYTLANGTATGTITPQPLTITAPTIASKTYDGTTTAGAVTVGTLSGFVGIETVKATATAANYSSANVGSYTGGVITYTLANGTHGGLATNYSLSNDIATGTVTAKALIITAPSIASKTYDGTTTAGSVTVGTLSGFIGTETVSATATAANYSSANVGSYTGNVVTYTLANGTNGGLAANYSLANGSATGKITVQALTATGTTIASKTYDGTKTAGAVTVGTISGLAGTETLTITALAANYSSANVGSYPGVAVSYTLADGTNGGLAANYSMANGTANGTIITQPLTITAPSIASKTYDGTTSPGVVTAGTLLGLVGIETIKVTATAANYSGANAGSYPGVAITYTLANGLHGGLATNYSLTNGTATGTIIGQVLTITAPTIASKIYDGTTTAGAVTVGTLSGFIGTETVTATATAANYSSANVGSYTGDIVTYTLADGTNGGVAANYTLANGTATGKVTAKALTITAPTIASKVFDDTKTAGAVTVGTLSGLVGTETLTVTGTAANYANVNAGSHTGVVITYALADGTGGGLASNYTLANGTATGTITKKALTIIGLTVAPKTYNGTTAAVITGTAAFLASEAAGTGSTSDGAPYIGTVVTVTGTATGVFNSKNVATATTVTLSGLTLGGTSKKNYTLTKTIAATITPKALTITADNESKASGSTFTFAGTEFTTSTLISGDAVSSVTLTSAGAPSSAAIGSYSITPSAAIGTGLTNYTITYSNGTLTVTGNSWTGAVNSDWNTPGNWSFGTVPNSSSSDVAISNSPYPVLSGNIIINNLTLTGSSTTLNLNGQTLTMDGAVSGTGSLQGSAKSSLVIGGTTGTLKFSKGSDTLENLTLNNNATATLGSTLNITSWTNAPGTVNIGTSAVLNTSDSLTLQSNDSSTAIVTAIPEDAITGVALGTISGNVTVERYIHSDVNTPGSAANGVYNTSLNNGLRAWRLLTAPVTQSGSESIQAAWQNGGAPYTPGQGIGTLITAPVASNGIDAASGISMYSWNTTGQAFANMTNTLGAISNGNYGGTNAGNTGYMIFVRGDRNPASLGNPNNGGVPIDNTTMEPKGNLITGRQIYTVLPSTGYGAGQTRFTLIGNPYASPVDLAALTASNVRLQFYIWNPNLNTVGGFVTLDLNAGLTVSTPNTGYETQYIQSGQAFFAVGLPGAADSLTFDEANKTNSNNNYVFRPASGGPAQSFVSNLYLLDTTSGNTTLADGSVAQYNTGYNAAVDYMDALKLNNTNENLSLVRTGVKLSLERRPLITNSDTLFLNLTQTTKRAYQFKFTTSAMSRPGLQGFLKDSYTGDSTALNLNGNTAVNFTIDANAASQNVNRFMVVFEAGSSTLPVTFTSIKATEQNNAIPVSWTVQNEVNIKSYVVQKSTDDKSFTDVATVTASGSAQYNWTDINAATGNNYYRIRSVATDGAIQYSSVAKVNVAAASPIVTIYPNPATNGVVGLQFTNMPKGVYTIKVLTTVGQVVAVKTINHAGGNASETVALNGVAKGMYELEIVKPDGSMETYNIEYQ